MQLQNKALTEVPDHKSSTFGCGYLHVVKPSERNAQAFSIHDVNPLSGWWILPCLVGGILIWAFVGRLIFSWL